MTLDQKAHSPISNGWSFKDLGALILFPIAVPQATVYRSLKKFSNFSLVYQYMNGALYQRDHSSALEQLLHSYPDFLQAPYVH